MGKKVKAFNVEEDVYAGLFALLKQHKVSTSLSSFVNNCLDGVLTYIRKIETIKKKHPEYDFPMSFVIRKLMDGLQNIKEVGPILAVGQNPNDIYEDELLQTWQDEYEGDKLGISGEMYYHVRQEGYTLDPNKQFLVYQATGKKYFMMPRQKLRGGILLELTEQQDKA